MKFIIHTDGGSRGNPGLAGCGVIVYNPATKQKKEYSKFLGIATNNQAEYEALILALEKAKELKATEIECYSDSQLLVEQLNRRYKVKNPLLGLLFVKVWNLSQCFKKISFLHISRDKNKEADNLVNQILDKNS